MTASEDEILAVLKQRDLGHHLLQAAQWRAVGSDNPRAFSRIPEGLTIHYSRPFFQCLANFALKAVERSSLFRQGDSWPGLMSREHLQCEGLSIPTPGADA